MPELPEPFRWEGGHVVAALGGARVLFSSRRGGVSAPPYDSLNLGRLTEDPDANVDANRDRLAAAVGLPRGAFLYGRQVHGTTVQVHDAPMGAHAEADGQVARAPGLAPLVFVADCLALLLAGPGGVAALHGGWRGLAGGIVAKGAEHLEGPLVAALGPCARACCYEVGEEVHAAFADVPGARAGARNLDLAVIARRQLAAAGVGEIHDTGLCTICDARFFSHRRDQGVTGRQAGVVWRA